MTHYKQESNLWTLIMMRNMCYKFIILIYSPQITYFFPFFAWDGLVTMTTTDATVICGEEENSSSCSHEGEKKINEGLKKRKRAGLYVCVHGKHSDWQQVMNRHNPPSQSITLSSHHGCLTYRSLCTLCVLITMTCFFLICIMIIRKELCVFVCAAL